MASRPKLCAVCRRVRNPRSEPTCFHAPLIVILLDVRMPPELTASPNNCSVVNFVYAQATDVFEVRGGTVET